MFKIREAISPNGNNLMDELAHMYEFVLRANLRSKLQYTSYHDSLSEIIYMNNLLIDILMSFVSE